MTQVGQDTLGTRSTMNVGGKEYAFYSLKKAGEKIGDVSRLPFSMKVLLENLLRFEDGGFTISTDDIQAIADWQKSPVTGAEIQYRPARVLLQDFTGVPCVVDLAAMRDAIRELGGDTSKINPQVPVNLVIDHSVMVDEFGHPKAFEQNVDIEYERNLERYDFLKWGSKSLDNFYAVPPGTGICHQVNLENIAQTVWTSKDPDGVTIAYPDTCVGTDSHTTMINGLGVLGWGVGGIEAEAAMLGQPVSMLIPEVAGFKLTGKLAEGVTATDLVLTCTNMLRAHGVVGRFVEYYGPGLASLSLADRATLANMAPEYGATCGFFGIDDKTLEYLRLTGREDDQRALVEAYAKEQGFWIDPAAPEPIFSSTLELDMGSVVPSLGRSQAAARPSGADRSGRRLQRRHGQDLQEKPRARRGCRRGFRCRRRRCHDRGDHQLHTTLPTPASWSPPVWSPRRPTNSASSPSRGSRLRSPPDRRSSLTTWRRPDCRNHLDNIGFNLVGYGCTTCIGNSGPLAEPISKAINDNGLVASAVISGNRNFEGRVSPDVRANFLASPPLVVAYALKGTVVEDFTSTPIGVASKGAKRWPSQFTCGTSGRRTRKSQRR